MNAKYLIVFLGAAIVVAVSLLAVSDMVRVLGVIIGVAIVSESDKIVAQMKNGGKK